MYALPDLLGVSSRKSPQPVNDVAPMMAAIIDNMYLVYFFMTPVVYLKFTLTPKVKVRRGFMLPYV